MLVPLPSPPEKSDGARGCLPLALSEDIFCKVMRKCRKIDGTKRQNTKHKMRKNSAVRTKADRANSRDKTKYCANLVGCENAKIRRKIERKITAQKNTKMQIGKSGQTYRTNPPPDKASGG